MLGSVCGVSSHSVSRYAVTDVTSIPPECGYEELIDVTFASQDVARKSTCLPLNVPEHGV
jgi:hypothetical protein